MSDTKKKIAIIGSGISGLGAAWLLAKRHDVTVFEQADYFGGHVNTLNSGEIPVDTGFIVYNTHNYPHLSALFAALNVQTEGSNMSFAVSARNRQYEYAVRDLPGFFGQRGLLISPKHWILLTNLLQFLRDLRARVDNNDVPDMTLGDFLRKNLYAQNFIDDYIAPMAAAIWSTPAQKTLDFGLPTLARFFYNHGLLQVDGQIQWRTVTGGAKTYVQKLIENTPAHWEKARGVIEVRTQAGKAPQILCNDGSEQTFDTVILACHSDESLALLSKASTAQQKLLSAVPYTPNVAYLHRDPRLMPKQKRVWAAWNVLSESPESPVCLTYWMNLLQNLNEKGAKHDIFVTLNPVTPPDPALTDQVIHYRHPLYSQSGVATLQQFAGVQGQHGVYFAGAWLGNGFHEDGLRSAVDVATRLGCPPPWQV